MRVGWLIDADMFVGYRDALVAAVREQGHEAKLIQTPSPPFRWDDVGCSYRETFSKDACVVSHGDIELTTRIQQEGRWRPGAFCTVENFFCSSYLSWCGKYWLNADYKMLPFGELHRQQDILFETFGRGGRVFIRPDSPLKLFTGQVVTRDTFETDLEFMGFYEFPASSPVVVSSPKRIAKEWRFVVAAGEVVAGCLYQEADEQVYRSEYDSLAFELAGEIASLGYAPDPVWVVDICMTSDNVYHLLEVGGFSFADLYACNMDDVVRAVSAVAADVWRRY